MTRMLSVTEEVVRRLARHNRLWQERVATWGKYAGAPWWGPGLVVSPELRGKYEAFLPVGEYIASLSNVARAFLPNEDWLPYPLRFPMFPSLPDFWADVHPHLAGSVIILPDQLLPLLCSLADPPSFGTIQGRYVQQLGILEKLAFKNVRILDVGCGVGLNTLEISRALARFSPLVQGTTGEHLEVWMAENRFLPHDPLRQRLFNDAPAVFSYGLAENFTATADIIVCNGLIGGRFFNQPRQFTAFLNGAAKAGARFILAANRFHDGRRFAVHSFMNTARKKGWQLSGSWNQLLLSRE